MSSDKNKNSNPSSPPDDFPSRKTKSMGESENPDVPLPGNNGQLPHSIGGYQIKKEIGRGAASRVYLGTDPDIKHDVAVKIITLDFREKPVEPVKQRFYQEVKIAHELNHPNIIRIYRYGEDGRGLYIIMEYAAQGDLAALLEEKGKLKVADAINVVKSIAFALVEAEKCHIVHRDIKPQNIVVTRNGKFKLVDLGIAKYIDKDNGLSLTDSSKGTPYYMSPEQVKDAKHVDRRADIYSLGVTFYEMVTGQRPFSGKNQFEVWKKIELGEFQNPRLINPSLDSRISNIICKMMSLKPDDRFQSAQEIIDELENCELFTAGGPINKSGKGKLLVSMVSFCGIVFSLAIFLQSESAMGLVKKPDHTNETIITEDLASRVKKSWNALPSIDSQILAEQKKALDRQLTKADQFLTQNRYEEAAREYLLTWKSIRQLHKGHQMAEMCSQEIKKISEILKDAQSISPEIFNKAEWKQAQLLERSAKFFFEGGELSQAYTNYEKTRSMYQNLFKEFLRSNRGKLLNRIVELRADAMALNAPEVNPKLWKTAENLFTHLKTPKKNNQPDVRNYLQWQVVLSKYNKAYDAARAFKDAKTAKIKLKKMTPEIDPKKQSAREIITKAPKPTYKSKEPTPDLLESEILSNTPDKARSDILDNKISSNTPKKTGDVYSTIEVSRKIAEEIPNRKIALAVRSTDGRKNYFPGENLSITLRAEKECYLAIFYHYTDGSTDLLFPNPYLPDLFVPANEYVKIPDESNKTKGFQLEVSEPFGSDVIQLIACTDKEQLNEFLEGYLPTGTSPPQPVVGEEIRGRLRGIKRGINLKIDLPNDSTSPAEAE